MIKGDGDVDKATLIYGLKSLEVGYGSINLAVRCPRRWGG